MTLITNLSKLPNLKSAKRLGFDLETKDPDLLTLGPGVRRDGRVVGIALAVEKRSWYLPIGHDVGTNVDGDKAWEWVNDLFSDRSRIVLGANIAYDLDYAMENGVTCPKVYDVLHAGRLLDMQGKFPSLNELLTKYIGEQKTGDELWEYLSQMNGRSATSKAQIGSIALAPPKLVSGYAEGDVNRLGILMDILEPLLKEREAWEWFLVEAELLPYLLLMRRNGIRVDVKAAEKLQSKFGKEHKQLMDEFGEETYPGLWKGKSEKEQIALLNINSGASLQRVFKARGIDLPKTATGMPSVTKPWLMEQTDSLSKQILRLRALAKLSGTFVESYILKHQINGRIHPELNQLFPRTIRMSSQNPNEQNIPKRDEILAPMIRGLFLPEEGEQWGRLDYDQQEYRLLVHFAMGEGAEEAKEAYRNDPNTDFHNLVWGWLPQIETRTTIKNANFAKTYRSGRKVFATTLGLSREEADVIFDLYDEKLPFVKHTGALAEKVARKRGYVNILLKGMRMYFDHWAIDDWDLRMEHYNDAGLWKTYPTREEALAGAQAAFPDWKKPIKIAKADTYKALNRVIQPSGAQLMKYGMVLLHRAGVTNVLGPALVSVHDELGFSVPRTKEGEQAFEEAERCMIAAGDGQISVPLVIGKEFGKDWGHLK